MIFTISHDQKLKWFEMTNRKQLATLQNPQKVVYTSIAWHEGESALYAADMLGFVYIIDIY
jgi:hypothetical protein